MKRFRNNFMLRNTFKVRKVNVNEDEHKATKGMT